MPGSVTDGIAETCEKAPTSARSHHRNRPENPSQDADLRRVVEAWPTLPDPVRASIVAMIEATAGA